MNLSLHLTKNCNLACSYCYQQHESETMSHETARAAVDLVFSYPHTGHGFSLFGGEPLLNRTVIEDLLVYAAQKAKQMGKTMSYKMTTNGTLLTEDFLQLADTHHIAIALSHDGAQHDSSRRFADGRGTAELLESKITLLLKHQLNAVALATVTPQTLPHMGESVRWLYERGFLRVNTALDARPDADWTDESIATLQAQYREIGDYLTAQARSGRVLNYLNFTTKIHAHVTGKGCITCELGATQPSVNADGKLYPCNQFVGLPEFQMGDVWQGVDIGRLRDFSSRKTSPTVCEDCAVNDRCRHACACLNYQQTGQLDCVSPAQCEMERLLIAEADRVGGALYALLGEGFLQRFGAYE